MGEQEEESVSPHSSPSSPQQVRELENGIFNMVVTLTRHLSDSKVLANPYSYVASYLERLATSLREMEETQTTEEGNDS